jgi:hypothetical protein
LSARSASRVALALVVLTGASLGAHAADAERQADVARRGAEVMPFDLSATTHFFTRTARGGTQRVVAQQPSDAKQVQLVRSHLHEIRQQFQRGDFSGPAHIHGAEMPGLAALHAAPPGAIALSYRDVKGGAELTYATKDAKLVDALHRWFDATAVGPRPRRDGRARRHARPPASRGEPSEALSCLGGSYSMNSVAGCSNNSRTR